MQGAVYVWLDVQKGCGRQSEHQADSDSDSFDREPLLARACSSSVSHTILWGCNFNCILVLLGAEQHSKQQSRDQNQAHQGEGQQDEQQAERSARDPQDHFHPPGDLHLAALSLPVSVRHASWRVQIPRIIHIPVRPK